MGTSLLSTEVLMQQALKLMKVGNVEPYIVKSWEQDLLSNCHKAIMHNPSSSNVELELLNFLSNIKKINTK